MAYLLGKSFNNCFRFNCYRYLLNFGAWSTFSRLREALAVTVHHEPICNISTISAGRILLVRGEKFLFSREQVERGKLKSRATSRRTSKCDGSA
jgi:hypothetical protein